MGNVSKKSHSFDPDLYAELAATAQTLGVSESAALALAAEAWLRKQRGLAAVAEWEAENGAFTEAELAEADRILDSIGVPPE
ncbi:MAG: hypothetical protein WCP28_22165 [Actinomycetes bacterium]